MQHICARTHTHTHTHTHMHTNSAQRTNCIQHCCFPMIYNRVAFLTHGSQYSANLWMFLRMNTLTPLSINTFVPDCCSCSRTPAVLHVTTSPGHLRADRCCRARSASELDGIFASRGRVWRAHAVLRDHCVPPQLRRTSVWRMGWTAWRWSGSVSGRAVATQPIDIVAASATRGGCQGLRSISILTTRCDIHSHSSARAIIVFHMCSQCHTHTHTHTHIHTHTSHTSHTVTRACGCAICIHYLFSLVPFSSSR